MQSLQSNIDDITRTVGAAHVDHRVLNLRQVVAQLDQRCGALQRMIEEQAVTIERLRHSLAAVAKRVDWQAEQVQQTATALFERIEDLRDANLSSHGETSRGAEKPSGSEPAVPDTRFQPL